MISPLFVALWLLCALGAAVFAASFRQSWYTRAALLFSFVVTAFWMGRSRVLTPVWIGALTAIVAMWILAKPRSSFLAALSSGVLGGVLAAQLQLQMVPPAAAWVMVAALLLSALILAAGHASFTPPGMREEALLELRLWVH
jgi:uncharacterized membrane protein